jgi:RimJ/RimL family protein N-acetyltransferase
VELELREVVPHDLPILYGHQADPAVVASEHVPTREWPAFMEHWERIMEDPDVVLRTIVVDGTVVGALSKFPRDGKREVGYVIGREFWGRGIATVALGKFLEIVRERPLVANVSKTNAASIRVLEKCGFVLDHEYDDGYLYVI